MRVAGWQAGSFFTIKLLILAVISVNPASASELGSTNVQDAAPFFRQIRRTVQPVLLCETDQRMSCLAVCLEQLSAIQALDADWTELPAPQLQELVFPYPPVSLHVAPLTSPDAVRGP